MSIDCWMLRQCETGGPPALRFYQWSRPTLSLGHLQKDIPAHWRSLAQAGRIDIVRRPTGGRAVLHSGDLTYAVAARYRQGNRVEIYQHLCEFLIRGWRKLGVELHYGEAGRGYRHRPNCFGVATQADLVDSQGHKFIGSAQRYSRIVQEGAQGERVVLQHGSMQLAPDASLFEALFAAPAPQSPVRSPIDQALVHRITETLTTAAGDWFGVDLVAQPLTPGGLAEVDQVGDGKVGDREAG